MFVQTELKRIRTKALASCPRFFPSLYCLFGAAFLDTLHVNEVVTVYPTACLPHAAWRWGESWFDNHNHRIWIGVKCGYCCDFWQSVLGKRTIVVCQKQGLNVEFLLCARRQAGRQAEWKSNHIFKPIDGGQRAAYTSGAFSQNPLNFTSENQKECEGMKNL